MKRLIFSLFLVGFYTAGFATNDAELNSFTDNNGIIHYISSPYRGRFSELGNFNSGYCGLEPEFREMILGEPTPKTVTIAEVGPGDWFEGERILKGQKDNSNFNFQIIDMKEDCLVFAKTRFDENSKNPENTINLIKSDYIKALNQDSLKNQLDYIRLCWVTHFSLYTDNFNEIMKYMQLSALEKGQVIRDALFHSLKKGGQGLLIEMGHHDRAQQYGFESDSRFHVQKKGMFLDHYGEVQDHIRYSGFIFTKVSGDE